MAKKAYVGVNGVAKQIKKGYVGVGSVARKIKKAYIGVGGIARPFWGGGLDYYGEATALSTARAYLSATTIGSYGIFGGGGTSNFNPVTTVDAYNESLTRSTPTALSTAVNEPAATTVGSYALFGGGWYSTGTTSAESNKQVKTVDAYNGSLTKTTASSFSIAQGQLAATTVGSYAIFAGGIRQILDWTDTDVTIAYNESLTRSSPTKLSSARCLLSATTVGGYALFAGGATSISGYGKPIVSSTSDVSSLVDTYNGSLTKSTATSLSSSGCSIAATTVGSYALFGGGNRISSSSSKIVDAYNESLTRTTATSLSVGGAGMSATTVGGYALFTGCGTTVDAYDESLTKSNPTSLPIASYYGAATAVGNYAVFAIGSKSSSISSSYLVNSTYAYTV